MEADVQYTGQSDVQYSDIENWMIYIYVYTQRKILNKRFITITKCQNRNTVTIEVRI